jgi:molybdopterin-containing oxidoreductase family membrane subunit
MSLGLKIWLGVLSVFLILGAVSGIIVFVKGLGVTGLTDTIPWGLWIALDLSAISLGAGAFIMSAVVYLLRIRQFEGVARIAVLGGFLGYTSAMLALALDIGRPDRFWHPIIYWNVHSVLWEITMCVFFYFTVLALEMAVPLFESRLFSWWSAAPKFGHFLHKLTPVFAVAGLGLSLLHQSSLGATYGIIAARPLWYNPTMPVLFILSAAAGGLSASLFVTLVVSRLRGKYVVSHKTLRSLAIIAGSALTFYVYLKLWNWAATSYYSTNPAREAGLELLFQTSPYSSSFWLIEVLLGGVVPMIIFFWRRLRENDYMLMLASVLVIAGVVMLRWNTTISGLVVPLDWSPGTAYLFPRLSYTPTLIEFGAFFGIIAYALLGLTLGIRYLPIYPGENGAAAHH